MSQQEFFETPKYQEETSVYEAQGSIEPIREYAAWEQNNAFVTRHLHGEKVQPQPEKKSAVWSLIPLLVLLFLVAGGAFGLTAAFHSAYSAPAPWNGDDFAPGHEWHHHHHFHCQVITMPVHRFGPGSAGMQGDDSDHIIVIQGPYTCGRP
jgi:hypothetical protein